MNPWTTLANALKALPPNIRRTLYTIVTAAGALLAVGQILGWKTLGPIDMDQALKVYALVSSPTGFLALANVSPKDEGAGSYGSYGSYAGSSGGFQDDFDYDPSSEASFS
jgi:hypothetical protein